MMKLGIGNGTYSPAISVASNQPRNEPLANFSNDWPLITPWIKSISIKLDITPHVIASQLSGHCDVISNRLWRHQQNENRASGTRVRCVKIVLSSFIDSLCRVGNKIMYALSWWTVSTFTRVLFWCLFPSSLRNSGKHQNNPFVSAETVGHPCTYIIIYIIGRMDIRFSMEVSIHRPLLFGYLLVTTVKTCNIIYASEWTTEAPVRMWYFLVNSE